MSPTQIEGQIRTFLAFASGIAAALGLTWFGAVSQAFLDAAGPVLNAVGPVLYFVTIVWSLIKNKQSSVVTAAATVPGVSHIVLQPNPAGQALAPNSVTPSNVALPSGSKL